MIVLFMKAKNPGYSYQRGGKTITVAPFDDKRPAAKTPMKRSLVGKREDAATKDLYDNLASKFRGKGSDSGREAAKTPPRILVRKDAFEDRTLNLFDQPQKDVATSSKMLHSEAVETKQQERKMDAYKFPSLEGSEKQIAWAEKLRPVVLKKVGAASLMAPKEFAAYAVAIAGQTQAKYWIDLRDLDAAGWVKRFGAWAEKQTPERLATSIPENLLPLLGLDNPAAVVVNKPRADRVFLHVPFDDKDAAKDAGARWDAGSKSWYYPGSEVPDSLRQFVRDGDESEQAVWSRIEAKVKTLIDGLPGAWDALHAKMSSGVPAKPGMEVDAERAVKAILAAGKDAVLSDATMRLASLVSRDSHNLNSFLSGGHSDPLRAIMTTFNGPGRRRASEVEKSLEGATAAALVGVSAKKIADKEMLSIMAEAKSEAIDRAKSLLDKIDPTIEDEFINIDGHAVEFAVDADGPYRVESIDGKREINDRLGKFAVHVDRASPEFAAALSAAHTARKNDRESKADSFVVRSATKAGDDMEITSTDGRSARAYYDDGAWHAYEINGKPLTGGNKNGERIGADAARLIGGA